MEIKFSDEDVLYKNSFLNFVSPEYSTGEVLLAGALREILLGITEKSVTPVLLKQDAPPAPPKTMLCDELAKAANVKTSDLESIFAALSAPSLSKEKKDLLFLSPFTPEMAAHGGVIPNRTARHWNAGNLFLETLGAGAGSQTDYDSIVTECQKHFGIGPEDDLLGKFIENSFVKVSKPRAIPKVDFPKRIFLARCHGKNKNTPAEQFCVDLRLALDLKKHFTRKQWLVLIEALFRLGLVTHVMWLCHINASVKEELIKALNPAWTPPDSEELEKRFFESHTERNKWFLTYGGYGDDRIKDIIEDYAKARIFINTLLEKLQLIGDTPPIGGKHNNLNGFIDFLRHVNEAQGALRLGETPGIQLESDVSTELGSAENVKKLNCEAPGFPKNMFEFMSYSLRQLMPAAIERKSYDQSYLLRKSGVAKGARWEVDFGPNLLLSLVFLCCKNNNLLPTSVIHFREYLAGYGINIPEGAITEGGALCSDMEKLGLLVDSPDSDGGRLLVNPFDFKE